MPIEKSSDLIGIRNCDHSACSIVAQLTMLHFDQIKEEQLGGILSKQNIEECVKTGLNT
jgi:hypothetical protein